MRMAFPWLDGRAPLAAATQPVNLALFRGAATQRGD